MSRPVKKRPRSKPRSAITLIADEPQWRRAVPGLAIALKRAVRLAVARGRKAPKSAALTILLTGDEELRKLNMTFRRKNQPTNVLSFPARAAKDAYLGDVAIAYGVSAREALAAGKPLADHATHLAVHGTLHLLGYDHERARDARVMEALETKILAELGISDPYRTRATAA